MSFDDKWEEVSISDVADVVLGGTPKTKVEEYWNGDIKWASAKDISNCKEKHIYNTEKTISKEGLRNSSAKILPSNTIVITSRGTVGEFCMIGEEMSFNQSCYGLIAKNNINHDYLYYKLKELLGQINSLSYGSIFDTITMRTFDNIKFKLPPLEIQKKAANILAYFDEKIENNNKMNKTLEEIAQAIFKNWFVDFEPFQDEEFVESELGMIPKGWEVKKIKDISDVVLGKTPSTRNENNYGDKYPFIRLPDMNGKTFVYETEKYLSEEGHKTQENKLIPEDSILVSCIGTIGEVVINSKPSHTNQQINTIVCENYLKEFLFITAKKMKKRLIKIGSGGTTMGNVNKTTFQNLKIIFPPEEVINDFHKIASHLFNKIKHNNFENNNLAQIRDTLLPKLMSGEIRVEDLEEEEGG